MHRKLRLNHIARLLLGVYYCLSITSCSARVDDLGEVFPGQAALFSYLLSADSVEVFAGTKSEVVDSEIKHTAYVATLNDRVWTVNRLDAQVIRYFDYADSMIAAACIRRGATATQDLAIYVTRNSGRTWELEAARNGLFVGFRAQTNGSFVFVQPRLIEITSAAGETISIVPSFTIDSVPRGQEGNHSAFVTEMLEKEKSRIWSLRNGVFSDIGVVEGHVSFVSEIGADRVLVGHWESSREGRNPVAWLTLFEPGKATILSQQDGFTEPSVSKAGSEIAATFVDFRKGFAAGRRIHVFKVSQDGSGITEIRTKHFTDAIAAVIGKGGLVKYVRRDAHLVADIE